MDNVQNLKSFQVRLQLEVLIQNLTVHHFEDVIGIVKNTVGSYIFRQ